MGDYSQAAEFYDLLYEGAKNYTAEAKLLSDLMREQNPEATSVLDVGCGTGSHARCLLDAGFTVHGVDLEPAFVEAAREKCPEGTFEVGDMRTLDLPDRFDSVLCLFSAIGYVQSEESLNESIRRLAGHLSPDGLLIVDPWFEPGQMTDGFVLALVAESQGLSICRMSRTVIEGAVSRLEFEYLIGTADGIERRSEVHELALFTQKQMESAFVTAGLRVERKPEALRTRGVYVGTLV